MVATLGMQAIGKAPFEADRGHHGSRAKVAKVAKVAKAARGDHFVLGPALYVIW